jgi:hypothetical protein
VGSGAADQRGEAIATQVVSAQLAIDFTDFKTFTYAQRPFGDYLVPCGHLGVLEATITQGEGTGFTFAAELLLPAPSGSDCEAAWDVSQGGEEVCTQRRALPARHLALAEEALLGRAFGAVHVWTEAQPGPVCDEPCSYESFIWDGEVLMWEACVPGSRLIYEDAQEINAVLNRLAATSLESEGKTVPDVLR